MKTKLLIFGITGDLSSRKLLPALAAIRRAGELPDLEIIGVSRRDITTEDVLSDDVRELKSILSMFTMNLEEGEAYDRLKDYVALDEDEQLLVYLSVPPSAAGHIVRFMGEAGLNTPNVKLLLEKPFGVDLASAHVMAENVARYYDEAQVYRIDHFLAKEMAQNIVIFRAKNALFGHVWNNQAVEKIEINLLEELDLEGRAQFYEQTGAMRDVVQSHLLQLLALILMETPEGLDWNRVPALRHAALAAVMPADPLRSQRAQYEGYGEEAGNPGSQTETFVRMELFSGAPEWQGIPLVLTHGKAFGKKATEIRISFKKTHDEQTNCLVFRMQPKEEIEIDLFVKRPGYEKQLEKSDFRFTYPGYGNLPDAYEHVLLDAVKGYKSLFASSAEIIESWRIVQPLLDHWNYENEPLPQYPKGSSVDDVIDTR